jgi:hypothetical protein
VFAQIDELNATQAARMQALGDRVGLNVGGAPIRLFVVLTSTFT